MVSTLNSTEASIEQPQEDFGDIRNRSLCINLPHQPPLDRLGVDIGGSLAKLVYFQNGHLHFASFETEKLDMLLDFMKPLVEDLAEDANSVDGTEAPPSPRKTGSASAVSPASLDKSELLARPNSSSSLKTPKSRPTSRPSSLRASSASLASKWLNAKLGPGGTMRRGRPMVNATGGGAFKHHEKISEDLSVDVAKFDEIESLIRGATFFLSQVPNEVVSWDPLKSSDLSSSSDSITSDPMILAEPSPVPSQLLYPYMIVNIGSGVGFIKVEGPNSFERVGGSALGGGTLWGLLAMLTPAHNFDEMLQMAAQGDNTNVDMLVGDIYGAGYPRMGLSATTTASFFAKAFKAGNRTTFPESNVQTDELGNETSAEFNAADISRSLLVAISYNIAQLAYLHARFHGIENIYFAGSYIRGHPQTIETIANGIRYWSKGDKTAYFFRHEGYLGAMGAFLGTQEEISSES